MDDITECVIDSLIEYFIDTRLSTVSKGGGKDKTIESKLADSMYEILCDHFKTSINKVSSCYGCFHNIDNQESHDCKTLDSAQKLALYRELAQKRLSKMEELLNLSSAEDHDSTLNKRTELEAASNSLTGMTEKEMHQHLEHCMKLAAENKINMKNAFGLHLISIMQNLVKQKESTDLTLASLSLQASSKIYASRIEALYKETFQFHGHLQTIVVGGKTGTIAADDEDALNEDGNYNDANERKPQKKKLKSYLCSEESISVSGNQTSNFALKPHENFELIKSAFSATRTTKKLLDSLQVECDSCKISCGTSSKCFKLKEPTSKPITFCLTKQIKGKLAALENLNIQSTEHESSESIDKTPDMFGDVTSWGSACIGGSDSYMENNGNELDVMIDRFSVLDITADTFARDISQAITKGNIIDEQLLPPQSTLKKVLRTTEKKVRKSDKKTKREKKPREPFFVSDQIVDNSLFAPGKKITLTSSAISDWNLNETTVLCTGHDKFFSELATESEISEMKNQLFGMSFYSVISEMEPYYNLKNLFFKREKLWKRFWKLHSPQHVTFSSGVKIRPSSFGTIRGPETENNAFAENEDLVQSFRDMSIHDFIDENSVDDGPLDLPSIREEEISSNVNNRSGFFEDDIQLMMVAPPELVKPLNVRFHQKPLTIDSDRLKTCMWGVISSNLTQNAADSVLFSEVCVEVQKQYKPDKNEHIPQQLSFVVLLILANQKDLYLENMENSKDIIIKMDSSELSFEVA
ncbi:condensin complex subunit 2 [Nephila pilipes]|uniref:Condensin complex subunit 2 n=1 Tax=Nephila pilipes TaxID=299642 RepID=A0A8X6QNX0_NEPPI|nr:condensin complex subunit 2 [Nephila pilipes]